MKEICENEYVRNLILRSSETKSWNCQPLPEDVHLRSFNALKLEHISLKFDINKLNQLSLFDEVTFFFLNNKFEIYFKKRNFILAFIETMQSKKIWIFDSEFV